MIAPNNTVVQSKPRERWLDVLKLLSSYLIIVIHSAGEAYSQGPAARSDWFGYLLLNILPRCAVPVFLLITGIFVLGRPMEPKKWVRKLLHFLMLLLFWNTFYIILNAALWHRDMLTVSEIIKQMVALPVRRGPSGHLWYSYQLVWIYALAPFLFKLYNALSAVWQRRLILFTLFIPSLLTCYEQFFDLGGTLYLPSFGMSFHIGYMGILFLGRYLYDNLSGNSKLRCSAAPMVVLGIGITVLLSWAYYLKYGTITDQFFGEMEIGVICYGTGIFILAYQRKNFFQQIPDKFGRVISWLAERAIGIYFLHCAFMWWFGSEITLLWQTFSCTGTWWSMLCYALIIWVLSAVSVAVLSKIPGISSLVGNYPQKKNPVLGGKLLRYKFLFEELVKRDFKKKYKRTVLGAVWSLLSPLMMLLVMRLVFTQFFGQYMDHYTTYLFCGNLVFAFFDESTSQGMSSLMDNAGIFTKVNVPKYLFLLSKNVQCLINFALTLCVFVLFCVLDGITFTWRWIMLLYPIGLLVCFNIGMGLILSALFVFFRDIQYLWSIFTQLLMYMSAIFYSIDSYTPNVQNLFLLNPVYLFIRYFRKIVIEAAVPSLWFHALMLADTLIDVGIGCFMYKKYNHRFLYYV